MYITPSGEPEGRRLLSLGTPVLTRTPPNMPNLRPSVRIRADRCSAPHASSKEPWSRVVQGGTSQKRLSPTPAHPFDGRCTKPELQPHESHATGCDQAQPLKKSPTASPGRLARLHLAHSSPVLWSYRPIVPRSPTPAGMHLARRRRGAPQNAPFPKDADPRTPGWQTACVHRRRCSVAQRSSASLPNGTDPTKSNTLQRFRIEFPLPRRCNPTESNTMQRF